MLLAATSKMSISSIKSLFNDSDLVYLYNLSHKEATPIELMPNMAIKINTLGRYQSIMDEEASHSLTVGCESVKSLTIEDPGTDKGLPLGKPLSTMLPPELIGDVLEVWNFFWRFHELLGLQEPLSFDLLSEELIGSWSDEANLLEKFRSKCPERKNLLPYGAKSVQKVLSKAHISMLKVLISELPKTDADALGPNCDNNVKQKHGTEKDMQNVIDMPPVNELTWPELARRYALAVSSINGDLNSAEVTIPVLRCLYGDGGLLCGSLTGVAGIEADAKVLATAMKKIYGSLQGPNDYLTIPDVDSDEKDSSQKLMGSEGIPNWAQELIPVRNLPTNNGSRIKKCVHAALGKGPPDWAKKMLENSISKEVYKGNASGPTKRAVECVLEEVCSEILQQKSAHEVGKTKSISLSDIIMKQCRILLRQVAAGDKRQVFCNLPCGRLTEHGKNIKGTLGSQAIVSRPLYFRMIDMRLAACSYGGSHEAFLEDVRELWSNVRVEFGDKRALVELADTLSRNFESLYNTEVVDVYRRLKNYAKSKLLCSDVVKNIENLVLSANNVPKAPWEEGICKVCGIDRDDDIVLLCDTCDAEHHIYCLNPPLATIPEGKWYCSSCIAGNDVALTSSSERLVVSQQQRSNKIESKQILFNGIAPLAASMEEEEYWMLCPHEKTLLLKFFCDKMLTSNFITQHFKECESSCPRLRREMRSLSKKLKDLKCKENDIAMQDGCLEMYAKQSEEYCPPTDPSLTMDASELVSNPEVLKSVRNEIQILKNSITNLETELKMRSLRTEFLGVDSAQKFYWIMELVEHPQIIVAEGISQDYQPRCLGKNFVSIGNKDLSSAEGSEARCPVYEEGYRNAALSSWVSYQSDAEIKRMIVLLKDHNPIDRQLKKSISQWHRLRFRDPHKSHGQNENELQLPFEKPSDNFSSSDCLITKAFRLLVSKYGTFLEMETICSLKNQDKLKKVVAECKMYRCTCLEPIPTTADHCLICHKTSFNKIEIKEHNRKCVVPASSSKPVVCKASHVLRQLKINLLDMYVALPEDALRSSKVCFDRRCAWRAFVKCASTIYEMVLASIALEDMIKSEYLNQKWWFWSSLSAAAKISTLSSLSLRIYSLDAAIIYEKIPSVSAPLKPKSKPNGKKRQNDPGSSSTGNPARRVNRKRKEPDV